jgi:hypothetical protein
MQNSDLDRESEALIRLLDAQERVRANRVPKVETVLVVLSSRGMVYDQKALTEMIQLSYPGAAVFFRTTQGQPIGIDAPEEVSLLIDFTGPGQKQGWFYAKKLHSGARFRVGRNALLFRKSLYDRVYDEKANAAALPPDLLARERFVQRKVLELAGVAFAQHGEVLPDHSKEIATRLPSLQRTVEAADSARPR